MVIIFQKQKFNICSLWNLVLVRLLILDIQYCCSPSTLKGKNYLKKFKKSEATQAQNGWNSIVYTEQWLLRKISWSNWAVSYTRLNQLVFGSKTNEHVKNLQSKAKISKLKKKHSYDLNFKSILN